MMELCFHSNQLVFDTIMHLEISHHNVRRHLSRTLQDSPGLIQGNLKDTES